MYSAYFFVSVIALVSAEFKRVCIYPNWAALRASETARLFPRDIDPFLCTHIHFAYANIDVRTLQLIPSQDEDTTTGFHGEVTVFIWKNRHHRSGLKRKKIHPYCWGNRVWKNVSTLRPVGAH
jgi:hypothetical protein